jgi:hypothetical protein
VKVINISNYPSIAVKTRHGLFEMRLLVTAARGKSTYCKVVLFAERIEYVSNAEKLLLQYDSGFRTPNLVTKNFDLST